MANQYPSIVPSGYTGDYQDFFRVKCDKSGAARLITGSVAVPSGTTSGTIIGLFPFVPGFKLAYGSWFNVGALGTSVTLALGYYFENSTLTSATAGYAAASTAAAAGGVILPSVVAGATVDFNPLSATLGGEGWVVAVTGGATTGSAGNITFNALMSYDLSGVTN